VPSTLATNAVDVADSVWGGTNQLIFESTTADANETIITAADSILGDVTLTIPIDNAQWDGAGTFVLSDLITNAPDEVNGTWFEANTLVFEGAQDAFEQRITPTSAGQDLLWTLPDIGAATGAVMFSTLATNNVNIATSISFGADTLIFEGATGADTFQMIVSPEDPVAADRTWTIADYDADAAFIGTTLVTNAPGAANSLWVTAVGVVFEGAGVDAFETIITAEDPTIGVHTYSFMDRALAADTYNVIATPDGEMVTGNLYYGEYTDAVAAAANADNVMLVKRAYVPHPITVVQIDTLNIDLANVSAADNTIAVAIYADADAGVQIVELVGATDDGAGAATGLYSLDIADTTLLPGWYRFAFCAQDASDNDIELHQTNADVLLIHGAGAAPGEFTSTATNPCVAGDPPATTGALVQGADNMVFMLRAQ